MEISVSIHTYNTYGGHSSVSLVGEFFMLGIPIYGEGIRELDVHVYFQGGIAKTSLESLYEQYHDFLKKLPSTKFYRKKQRFELNYVSKLGNSGTVSGFGPAKLGLFTEGAKEVAAELSLLKAKIKKSDDFQCEEFLSFISDKITQLPKSEDDFSKLLETIEVERARKLDAMDEWEKLGVDWIDFHGNSRKILDSTFFWDCAEDFSPNGNDTGADVLSLYQDWRKRNRRKPGMVFFDSLMTDWDVNLPPAENDEFSRDTYEQSIVGLAFAQLKVDGACDLDINRLALDAIESYRKRLATSHRDWDLYDERGRTLQLIEDKLREYA